MNAPSPRRQRGIAMPVVIAIVAIIIVLAAAAWFLIFKPRQAATETAQPASVAAASTTAAPPPANVAAMTTDQLLDEARKAVGQQRLLAPAGNNAFEFYLKVLQRQPNNKVAQDALRETFPIGANAAEQEINQNAFDEAQREIDLLAKSDPDNYTLTILRSKLDAQRKMFQRQQDQQAQQQQQQEVAAEAAKKQAAADKLAEQQKAAQAAEAARQAAARQAQQQAAAKPQQQTTQPQQQPTVQITDARLMNEVAPRYPAAAQRSRREGWVDVEFTVGTDGSVSNVHVVDSRPSHVFDRAAIDAVQRWRYQPALRNGQPMAVTMRRRINFKLGG